jgi:TRAP-type mannitol/chloroaromatic compound transport system permease small subunit|tara:strand:+ start:5759 stop:6274 length:516 start_codon:yes stop_codon:yes gene_type:complete
MSLSSLLKLSDAIDRLNHFIGRSAAWLSLLMVIITLVVVVLRYGFQIGSIALQESIMYINALVFTLGAAYTLKEEGHVRVDIFYSNFNHKNKAIVDIIGVVCFLFVTSAFVAWSSWDYVSVSWRILESSPETSGLPFVYLLKSTIYILITLLCLQGISELIKSINTVMKTK